jgi:hypothetical protein
MATGPLFCSISRIALPLGGTGAAAASGSAWNKKKASAKKMCVIAWY